ncbi:MAG: NRDE family protein [Bryobacterales bacterium]|nr:NRDE family protein [Bryobacterales bacterium]
MCTVSWLHQDTGYRLLCNRDEKKTRLPALPPQSYWSNGVRYIAPRDGDGGGTWIATNERGMTLCLLNGAPRRKPFLTARSRGLLIPDLIASPSLSALRERVASMNLASYAPFLLAGLEPSSPATLIEWDGLETIAFPDADSFMPLTSSSFDPQAVCRRRKAEFARLRHEAGRVDAGLLHRFHSSHEHNADAYATCMHRPDAQTVSFTSVQVSGPNIEFRYWDGPPCTRSIAA